MHSASLGFVIAGKKKKKKKKNGWAVSRTVFWDWQNLRRAERIREQNSISSGETRSTDEFVQALLSSSCASKWGNKRGRREKEKKNVRERGRRDGESESRKDRDNRNYLLEGRGRYARSRATLRAFLRLQSTLYTRVSTRPDSNNSIYLRWKTGGSQFLSRSRVTHACNRSRPRPHDRQVKTA